LAQEPNSNKKICCATLKEITGDKKTLNVRDIYSSKCEIDLRATMFLECNEIPSVDEVNDAVFRRIRIIPFNSKYVSKDVYDTLENKINIFVANPFYKTDEFQNTYKQALFNLLLTRFKTFKDNKYKITTQPKVCVDKSSAFLATCDDIYSWFETCYEKSPTIQESKPIPFSDIYSIFINSTFFNNLSKADKRKYNKKYFNSKIEDNLFLRKCIKLRKSYHNSVQLNSDCLVGWKRTDDDDEISNNSD
jgi:phage/plasmid-associated DNA primase